MKIPAKFKEYIWLVNTIRKARRITFAEINEKWLQTDMSEGIELARSTFARHKDAIEDIFGIYIDCDRRMPLRTSSASTLTVTARTGMSTTSAMTMC